MLCCQLSFRTHLPLLLVHAVPKLPTQGWKLQADYRQTTGRLRADYGLPWQGCSYSVVILPHVLPPLRCLSSGSILLIPAPSLQKPTFHGLSARLIISQLSLMASTIYRI